MSFPTRFPSRTPSRTPWSAIEEAKTRPAVAQTLVYLLYLKPVFNHLRRKGLPEEDAKDLAQDFFAETVLQGDYLARLKRTRGIRFRRWIMASANNFWKQWLRDGRAQRRGGGRKILSLDELVGLQIADESPPRAEEIEFARDERRRHLVMALARLREEKRAKRVQFQAVYGFMIKGRTYQEIACRFGITSHQVKNYISRGKERIRELARDIIRARADKADLETEFEAMREGFVP